MASDQQIIFGPFCFDRTTQRLRQGPREIRLRAKTLAVLQYLLEHPGRVISHLEFVQHVWVGTHVTRSVLRVCIWEIRQALGDAGATPQYIETVGQQGYRFCAPTRRTGASHAPGGAFCGPRGRAGRSPDGPGRGPAREAATRLRDGRSRHWQDDPDPPVSVPGARDHAPASGPGAVHRTLWGWRGIFALARRAGAVGARARGRAPPGRTAAHGPDVAGAPATARGARRDGRAAAPGAGDGERAHAAAVRRGPHGPHA